MDHSEKMMIGTILDGSFEWLKFDQIFLDDYDIDPVNLKRFNSMSDPHHTNDIKTVHIGLF